MKLPEATKDDGQPLTRRKVLSQIAACFDPLGLVSPTLLDAKLFIQHLWAKLSASGEKPLKRDKLWDQPLDADDQQRWKEITKEWKQNSNLIIPRRLFSGSRDRKVFQLHVFSDASVKGLGIAIYLRAAGKVKAECHLVFARSKVIPKEPRKRTVPRLELQAAFLASKIAVKIQDEFSLPLDRVQLWTDSENLVKWLCQKENQKDAFINRRLEAISHWHVKHVSTTENPADIASRGMKGEDLAESIWFNGPKWLSILNENDWPASSSFEYDPTVVRESKTERIFHSITAAAVQIKVEELFKCAGLSTSYMLLKSGIKAKTAWRKLKGAAVYVLRFLTKAQIANAFLSRLRPNFGTGSITVNELEIAEQILIKLAQKDFPADSDLESSLGGFFTDENGILRCKGRIDHSELPMQQNGQFISHGIH